MKRSSEGTKDKKNNLRKFWCSLAVKRRYKLPRNRDKHRTAISVIEAIIKIMADIIENNYYFVIIGYLTNCSWS